tara:strand:+ start:238 stop:819 length:582 start_codon:yes stop_codon:yes gene_type:complete
MTAKIIPLFSSPLYTNYIEYDRDKISKFIKNIEYREVFRREELNDKLGFLTVNKHILDNEVFFDLKKSILNEIENFLHRSLIINKPYQIYQSWITKTPPNCKSNYHTHTSVFSGVFYLDTPENSGDIMFKDFYTKHIFDEDEFLHGNYLNAQNWHIEPKDGLLIMFPSHVHHKISTNLSNEDRYSLAFDITKL